MVTRYGLLRHAAGSKIHRRHDAKTKKYEAQTGFEYGPGAGLAIRPEDGGLRPNFGSLRGHIVDGPDSGGTHERDDLRCE